MVGCPSDSVEAALLPLSQAKAHPFRHCCLLLLFRRRQRCLGGRFADRLPQPLSPKKIPFRVAAHGRSWDDPYHWMRDTDDPDFARHLEEENAYADAFMAGTTGLQTKLFAEMRAQMPPEISLPKNTARGYLIKQCRSEMNIPYFVGD